MPYKLRSDYPGCSGWAVVNEDTGKAVPGGCHGTKDEAAAHLRALYANVEEAAGSMPAMPVHAVVEHHRDCPVHLPHGVTDMDGALLACKATPEEAQDLALHLDIGDAYPAPGADTADMPSVSAGITAGLTWITQRYGSGLRLRPWYQAAGGNADALKEYWQEGDGADEIDWGSPGDFDRCTAAIGQYVDDPDAVCAQWHFDVLGEWPATHAAEENAASARSRPAVEAGAGASWESVELIASGEWELSTGRASFTTADLQGAVAAAECPAVGSPILKIGHSDPRFPPRMEDGEPAIGWVANMRLNASMTKVVGDFAGMPDWLGGILPSAYPKRSVEGQWNFVCQMGHTHPFVVTAVALLGVTPPGVGIISSLNDIAGLYGLEAASALAAAPPHPSASTPGAAMPQPAALAAGTVTTIDDVRREFYEEAPWSQWIIEIQITPDGPVLIVSDDSTGQLYRVPVSLDDTEPGEVEFGPSTAVLVSYVEAPEQTQEASAGLAFPPGRHVRAAWGSRESSRAGYAAAVMPEEVRAAWDGAAAEKNLGDDPSAAQLKALYALPGDNKSASKLPHHDVGTDGKVGAANTTACSAAIAAINGGRGGLVGVSADDKKSAYNHLAAHLTAAGMEPPEFKGSAEAEAGGGAEAGAEAGAHGSDREGIENWPVVDATGEGADGRQYAEAGGNHGPYEGEHEHEHSAFGSQGSDETHAHMHSHQNDAVHNHVHAPVSAAPQAAASNETGGSDVEFTQDQLAGIAAGLGKKPAEVTPADIAQAFAAAAQAAAGGNGEPPRPPSGSGMYLVDASVLDDYRRRAAAGDVADKRMREYERDQVLAEAMRVGKFPQAKLEHYQQMWAANAEETRRYIAALAEGMVPVGGPVGKPGLDPDLPGSYEDQQAYKDLYPEDVARARAARRERDRQVLGG